MKSDGISFDGLSSSASYKQSIQHNYKMEPLSSLPPPYPFSQLKYEASPSAPLITTPDPDSILSECGQDTPDSSIKEEPGEDASEGGIITCKWRNCGREYREKQSLVEHINTNHIEHKKGCEDFPCFWEVSHIEKYRKLTMNV